MGGEYRFLTIRLLESPREPVYEWNVRTTERWMNVVAPLARPVFAWNHDCLMRNGAPGSRGCSVGGCWRPSDLSRRGLDPYSDSPPATLSAGFWHSAV
jgi:hypothetical protein